MGRSDAVAFTLELAAVWRRLGAKVTFEPGWERRGNGLSADYVGGIVHHTASPSSASRPFPTQRMLQDGRPDLRGPLCNSAGPWCADDDPHIHVMAAHPANHAGASGGRSMGPLPVTGLFNRHVWGHEIDYAGDQPMTRGQYRAALVVAKGLSAVLGRSVECVRAHYETSVTGKWDPGQGPGRSIDMTAFRRDADALQEDDMPLTDADVRKVADAVLGTRLGVNLVDRRGKSIENVSVKEAIEHVLWALTGGKEAFRRSGDVWLLLETIKDEVGALRGSHT